MGANQANGSWPVRTAANRNRQLGPMTGRARTRLDTADGAYGSEGHARCVPDRVVDQRPSRSLVDSLAGLPTWVDPGSANRREDLIRNSSQDGGKRHTQPDAATANTRYRPYGCVASS